MKKILSSLFLLLVFLVTASAQQNRFPIPDKTEFDTYWNAGTAELSSYALSQARYGELHEGTAILVFVTEPFDTRKQVKTDWHPGKKHVTTVLKLNEQRTFLTGLYPYSILTSTFHPIEGFDQELPAKITSSVQEWCGQVFTQLNQKGNAYELSRYSYFENESRKERKLKKAIPEDSIMTMLRINPNLLPVGEFKVISGVLPTRLLHYPIGIESARAEIDIDDETDTAVYTISYPESKRRTIITFESSFPYIINKWTETTMSGFGDEKTTLTTTAVRIKTSLSDYWNKNKNTHRSLRGELELSENK